MKATLIKQREYGILTHQMYLSSLISTSPKKPTHKALERFPNTRRIMTQKRVDGNKIKNGFD